MLLNATKGSLSTVSETSIESIEFEVSNQHLEDGKKVEKKIETRVRNIFKLALASHAYKITQKTSVCEVSGLDAIERFDRSISTYKELFKDHSIDEKKLKEEIKWKKLNEDLIWFVVHNAKIHGDLSYHKVLKEERDRISEAKGTYYKNAIRKKIVTLNLVRWFKNRLRIKIKKGGKELKIKRHAYKYKIMRHLIVRRLLKDIIASGVYSYIRKKVLESLQEKNRSQLKKRKFAENRYKFLVHQQIQSLFQKLVKASKFSVQKRRMRTQFINRRLLRITKALKRKVGKKIMFGKEKNEKESKEFQYRYWLNELQHRLNAAGHIEGNSISSTAENSQDVLLNIVKDVLKKEGSPNENFSYIEEAFRHNINAKYRYTKPIDPEVELNSKKKSKPKVNREFKLDKETENMVRKMTLNTMQYLKSAPKKLSTQSRPSFKPLSKNYLSLAKIFIMKNTKPNNLKKLFKNEYKMFLNSLKENKKEKMCSNKFHKKSLYKQRNFKLGKRQLPRCTVHNLKSNRKFTQKPTEILRKHNNIENEKKNVFIPWTTFYTEPGDNNSDTRYSSNTYNSFVNNLHSRVKGKDSDATIPTSTVNLVAKKEMIRNSHERMSPAYSKVQSLEPKASEEKEKNRLEKIVLRSSKTKYEEMRVTPPRDKDLRVTNILGGVLARHAWKKFYTGKSKFKTYKRVQIILNSRNKRSLGVDFKLYKPYKPTNRLQYYLVVEGFDLTPRRFKSKLFPYCPLRYDALSFFSKICKESDNRKKNKEDFEPKQSISRRSSRTYLALTLSDDQRRSWTSQKMPHQVFPLEPEKNTEKSDVPPMFSLRKELQPETEIDDRKNLKFRVTLQETETINLIFVESKFISLATNVSKMKAIVKDIEQEKFETHEISKFKGFRGERNIQNTPLNTPVSKRQSTVLGRKRSKRSLSKKGDIHKFKFKKDVKDKASDSTIYSELSDVLKLGRSKTLSKTVSLDVPSVILKDVIIEKKESEEEEIKQFEKKFTERGVQAVGKSVFTAKIQVDAPKRNNAFTQISSYDFYIGAKNNEKPNNLTLDKELASKIDEHYGTDSSSDDSELDSRDPLLVTKSNEFKDSLFMISRVLSSNIYDKAQLFYSRHYVDPLAKKLSISYHCSDVWTFHDHRIQLSQLLVTSISTHATNNNVIAVGYAKNDMACQDLGLVSIWNVKNISAPEKIIKFDSSVTYIEFSNPNTISVAFMGGYVAMINICRKRNHVIMNTKKKPTGSFLPIWRFTWFVGEDGVKFPVTCGADGCLYRYRLDGTFAHTLLIEAMSKEGTVHGIEKNNSIFTTPTIKEKPEMTTCVQHPTDAFSYLIGTSDGCVHICSLHLPTHIDFFEAQHGRINAIKFHPHCEHIFLTVGGDFSVRLWAIGIFEPLFTFTARNEYTEDASFSQIWPELMVSVSGEYVDIWNIRRKVDVPVQSWTNPKQLRNTSIASSTDGYSIIVGDVGGYVHVFRLCEMPCESKLKPEVLSDAIKSAISGRKDILAALTKLGYPFSTKPLTTHHKSSFSEKHEPKIEGSLQNN